MDIVEWSTFSNQIFSWKNTSFTVKLKTQTSALNQSIFFITSKDSERFLQYLETYRTTFFCRGCSGFPEKCPKKPQTLRLIFLANYESILTIESDSER